MAFLQHAHIRHVYKAGRLEDSGRQKSDEKLWRETVHSQSYATFFRHSADLSIQAVLLRKLSISERRLRFVCGDNGSSYEMLLNRFG